MRTAVSAPLPPEGGSGSQRTWVPAAVEGGWPRCPVVHQPGLTGRLDEKARRLSHEELAAAVLLAGSGHTVRSLAESRRGGRKADLDVCGTSVEVKSFLPIAERGRPPSPQSVFNKLIDAAGQADAVFLYGRGSGLTAATVRSGLARLADEGRAASLSAVRVVGDGFDLAWMRGPGITHRLRDLPHCRPPRPELGL